MLLLQIIKNTSAAIDKIIEIFLDNERGLETLLENCKNNPTSADCSNDQISDLSIQLKSVREYRNNAISTKDALKLDQQQGDTLEIGHLRSIFLPYNKIQFVFNNVNYCKISGTHSKTHNCASFIKDLFGDIINCGTFIETIVVNSSKCKGTTKYGISHMCTKKTHYNTSKNSKNSYANLNRSLRTVNTTTTKAPNNIIKSTNLSIQNPEDIPKHILISEPKPAIISRLFNRLKKKTYKNKNK